MISLYTYNNMFVGVLTTISDMKITRTLDNGDATLEFKYTWTSKTPIAEYTVKRRWSKTGYIDEDGDVIVTKLSPAIENVIVRQRVGDFDIKPKMRLKTDTDEWIIDNVTGNSQEGFSIVASLDKECFKNCWVPSFCMTDVTIEVAVQTLLDMFRQRTYDSQNIEPKNEEWMDSWSSPNAHDKRWTAKRIDESSPEVPGSWKTYPDATVPDYWIYESHEGIPWTIGSSDVTRERSFAFYDMTVLEVMENLATVYMCEISYDTVFKNIFIRDRIGEDRGVVFRAGVNLAECKKTESGNEIYTCILPTGKDGITIKGAEYINDKGIKTVYPYSEIYNYQYYNGLKTLKYQDDNYTNKQSLYDDMVVYLNEISKPILSFSIKILDFYAIDNIKYSSYQYNLGDEVLIEDTGTNISQKMRIVKTITYPLDPSKNSVEIANCKLSFDSLHKKLLAAAKIIEAASQNGKITMSKILGFEELRNDIQGV